jgi:DNA gyrase/topoisomerase IV subunit B
LGDLIRDLNLSKESSELLASRLKEKNVLHPGMKITFHQTRGKDLLPFFTEDNNLVKPSEENWSFRI